MNMRHPFLPAATIALALAACSQPAETEKAPTASYDGDVAPEGKAAEPAVPAIKPTDIPTRGGDGSPIELTALTEADVGGAKLKGELACSFAAEAAAPPILLAQGDVGSADPSRGIVKVGDTIEAVSANGGFDAMVKGTKFFAKGLQLRVALVGPAEGGGESPPRPATLTADRADGAQRVFAGLWRCGP
ncbi:hypothetical protein SAMN05428974_2301 [Sphingopyxis sp. YR583]|uniref:hypothetical protein n=1 Tax=Sphingopyxis sp. YR583 TaxID=1881047 RepID=UPI0008A7C2B8|nr:hypothetical protein [Sphingopyxis sp. YR583]SEH17709.1 hypothetical protein SAMN05428974_2301 [Sphingopyxis sp. YR583]